MVVRLAFENGVRAVQLFGCADADELMWEGELAQGPGAVCLGAQLIKKRVGRLGALAAFMAASLGAAADLSSPLLGFHVQCFVPWRLPRSGT